MRPFLPYFKKYLRKVYLALAAGILCGILYGAAGGLGLPLMIKYVVPRVLLPDPPVSAERVEAEKPRGLKRYFDLDRLFDRWLPPAPASQPPAAAPAIPATAPRPAPRRRLPPWEIWAIALWVPAIFLIRGVAGYLNTYLIQYAGVRILEQIRLDYFRKLQALPLAFFQRLSTGELIARGLNDTNQLQNTLTLVSNDLIKQPAQLVCTILAVVLLAFQEQGLVLVLVCLLTIPLAVLPIRYVGKKLVVRAIHLQA
ncbi:MAG: ABC transporter transmembrane domain-containing protein, partial [Opitutaceae bacterium]